MLIALTDQPINVAAVLQAAESDEAGAVNAFVGTVRNRSESRRVVRLHYGAYPPMALPQLRRVAQIAQEKWPMLRKIATAIATAPSKSATWRW